MSTILLEKKKTETPKAQELHKKLIDIINPRGLSIPLSDIAKGMQKSVDQVYLPEAKPEDKQAEDAWKWDNLFLIVVQGEGGRFCSYRMLETWTTAVIELLENCSSWPVLENLIFLTEADLEKYPYPEANRQKLRQVLQQQKLRLEVLKRESAGLERAWEWARGWVSVIKCCANEESLNMALQLYKSQKEQFEAYPEVLEWLWQVAGEQRASLPGFK